MIIFSGTFQMAFKFPALKTLSYTSGNIVDDEAEVLVNTVNCQLSSNGNPVMGAGVAKAFKEKWGSAVLDPYAQAIRSGELKPGKAILFDLPDGRKWAALATKDDWRNPSEMQWVESGLKELGEKLRAGGFKSVAITPPGCGNGGLDWKKVEPMVHRNLEGINVSMYAKPSGTMVNEKAVEEAFSERTGLAVKAKERDARIQKPLYGKVVDTPDVSFDTKPGVIGTKSLLVSFSVREENGTKSIPVFLKSDPLEPDQADRAISEFMALKAGDKLSLAGRWAKGKSGGWGFVAERAALGNVPLSGLFSQSPSDKVIGDPQMSDLVAGRNDDVAPVSLESKRYPINEDTAVAKSASMYFNYGWKGRSDVKSESTFEAILEGERTSTTRFDKWSSSKDWNNVKKGDFVRFFEDKEMKGRSVVVKVESIERINMATFTEAQHEAWSKAEGWSVLHSKENAKEGASGLQIRYTPVLGQKIIEGRGAKRNLEKSKEIQAEKDIAVLSGGRMPADDQEKRKAVNLMAAALARSM